MKTTTISKVMIKVLAYCSSLLALSLIIVGFAAICEHLIFIVLPSGFLAIFFAYLSNFFHCTHREIVESENEALQRFYNKL